MNAYERALYWTQNECFDSVTREKVLQIMEDEQRLLSCFGAELVFGTGGLRGILDVGTNRMNVYIVARATQGLADYLNANGGRNVAIAYDSRLCSKEFAAVTAGVLAENGLTAHVYPRLMPTPMLSFAVRTLVCDAGVVITASHNPAQYNGYKVYGKDGCQITQEAATAIMSCISSVPYGRARSMKEHEARSLGRWKDIPQGVFDAYIEKTLSCRVNPKLRTPIRMVYTPLYGTGLEPVRAVLSRMPGVECIEVTEQCLPDGHFPTCPKPNPELREALSLGLEKAKQEKADVLIATDPDSDRVGVAVRRKDGEFSVLTGNEVGLLMMEYILSARKKNGTLPESPIVVKTIVTSDLAFPIAQRYGASISECLTGFKYIGEKIGLLEAAGEAERYVFGFEESCGYLAGTHMRDKDAVMACMLVAEMAQSAAEEGCTLADKIDSLYTTYGYMENRLLNFDIEGAVPMKKMNAIMAELRAEPIKQLAQSDVAVVKDYNEGIEGLPQSNVLSYATRDGKKAIVRPSGTEPKIKVYLSASGADGKTARALLDAMETEICARMR